MRSRVQSGWGQGLLLLLLASIVVVWAVSWFTYGERSWPTYEALRALFTGIGLISIGATLLAQRASQSRQQEQLRATVTGSAHASVAQRQMQMDDLFVRHPELRSYFYDREPVAADSVDWHRAQAVSQLLANYFDTYLLQSSLDIPQLYDENEWNAFVKAHLLASPVLRDFVEDHPRWYSRRLRARAGISIGAVIAA